jgi:predicted transcriptional regulator
LLLKKEKQEAIGMVKLNKTDEKIVAALKAEKKELTLQELADKTGESPKKIFRSLRKLFENEIVETQARKYKLTGKDPKSTGKDKEENEELPE